ncbi:tetratricopeptide repeat-containing sensor histidine kinase [Fluviicola taffensis]|uniref:Signal transduction histidine kinase, LytS n=1 Tax=Fluviicola taffensis (strain DSM 16823 / NCIMB 13979 / RW262) TaxID=755732 RepID=F2IHH1_FLUTR|nr:tetratricopeptide repeat protein [Fluviicola taffensis]AEA43736.1 signal transduction histidine kinase, LytS [Fluviicola taffensis DSM 16823]
MFRYFLSFSLLLLCFVYSNNAVADNWDEATYRNAYLREKDNTKKFWRQVALGKYYQMNNVQKADSIRYAIIEASRIESDSAKLQALIYDLRIEALQGNKSAYYAKILQLQPYLSRTNSKLNQVNIFHLLGEYHTAYREFEQATVYLDEALRFSKQVRNYALIGETNRLLAKLSMEQNKRDASLDYAETSIQYARRSSDKPLMAKCMNMQALIYSFFGQVELSVSKNFIALQLAKDAGDLPQVAQYQREIGESQYQIFNYDNANVFFIQSRETAWRIRDKRLVGLANIDMGLVKLAKKEYDEAIKELKSAVLILHSFNDQDGLGLAHKFLGNSYNEQRKYDEALRYYNMALVYFESAANRSEIASVYHLVGTVFAEQGKYKNALNYLNRSIEIRTNYGYNGGVYPSYKEIADVYKKTGDMKLAYRYLNMYSDFTDSARIVEVSAKIAELSELYRSEQRERLIATQADSIELQRKQKENTELKNIFQTYIIIGFLVVLALASFILYYRLKQRNIRQLQQEAEMNQTLLRSQMNPHFVFNAMSVIQSYIYENDTKNSTKFLINFSKLMRLILENSSKEFISLATEIDILNKYLETQKLRFGDRFTYEVSVNDQLLDEEAIIPPMITQPFIENAIEHGQLHTIEGGFIHVRFTKDEEMLHVMIEDNGIGRKGSKNNKKSAEHKSMAMKITQDRINNLSYKYKILGRMEMEDYDKEEETGTLVNIYLPYRTEGGNG